MRFALLLVSLAAAFAGCGAEEDASPISSAVDRTAAADSARMAFRQTLRHADGRTVTLGSGRGVIDFARRRGRATLDAPLVAALTEKDDSPLFEMVYDDRAVYVRTPVDAGRARPWTRFEVPERLAGVGPQTPGAGLDFLREHAGDVEELGTATVRGVATTRYRVEIDLEKVAEDLPAARRRELERALAVGQPRVLPIEVWLDRGDVIRRWRTESRVGRGDEASTVVATTDYFDFGVKADVRIPPPSLVRVR